MRFRRKKAYSRRVGSRSFRRIGRKSRKSYGGGGVGSDFGIALSAAAYGAGREWLSQKAAPITTPLAGVLGSYADEGLFLAAGWALRHGKIPGLNKVKMARDLGTAVMVVESARIGSGVAGGMMTTTSSTGSTPFVYG